ncbi:hypothetical protein A6X20_01975 [Bradyrhizobium elkanii]|nr:hypothetical protein A6452_17265 [Bradyrhizobium elkanii]ODM86421.1 hypothetical protein A6X20_01975 [Bradyrhizobium elkanii]
MIPKFRHHHLIRPPAVDKASAPHGAFDCEPGFLIRVDSSFIVGKYREPHALKISVLEGEINRKRHRLRSRATAALSLLPDPDRQFSGAMDRVKIDQLHYADQTKVRKRANGENDLGR